MTFNDNQVLSKPGICISQIPRLSRLSIAYMNPEQSLLLKGMHKSFSKRSSLSNISCSFSFSLYENNHF